MKRSAQKVYFCVALLRNAPEEHHVYSPTLNKSSALQRSAMWCGVQISFGFLCAVSCVLCGCYIVYSYNHRDTEITEVARRRTSRPFQEGEDSRGTVISHAFALGAGGPEREGL